jgi:hypothetical protein
MEVVQTGLYNDHEFRSLDSYRRWDVSKDAETAGDFITPPLDMKPMLAKFLFCARDSGVGTSRLPIPSFILNKER